MKVKMIDLSLLVPQKSVINREEMNEREEIKFLKFVQSIKRLKIRDHLIHPILVYPKGKEYLVYAGQRRLKAFKYLYETEGLEDFKSIPCNITEAETSEKTLLQIMLHENRYRKNLSDAETIWTQVSMIPFYFGLENEDRNENFSKGMKIFKKYHTFYRSTSSKNQQTLIDEMIRETNNDLVLQIMDDFFEDMGITTRSFFRKTKIFEYDQEVQDLFWKRKISLKTAAALESAIKDNEACRIIIDEIKERSLSTKDSTSFIKQRIKDLNHKDEISSYVNSIKEITERLKETDLPKKALGKVEKLLQEIEKTIEDSRKKSKQRNTK